MQHSAIWVLLMAAMIVLSACTGSTPDTKTRPNARSVPASSISSQSSNNSLSSTSNSSSSTSSSSSQSAANYLIINEIVASPDDFNFLAGNDWFELYNPTPDAVSLSDYQISDSNGELIQLPDIEIPQGAYLTFAAVAPEEASPPEPYVPFKLAAEDLLTLYFQGAVVDRLVWVDGQADEGNSFGVYENAQQTLIPTPSAINQPVPDAPPPSFSTDLIVNEIVASSNNAALLSGNDWFELYNSGSNMINLSDYWIADSGNVSYQLPAQNLAPGDYLVVAAVDFDDPNPPSPYVPFKLGSIDFVALYNNDSLVGRLDWEIGDAPDGKGFGFVNSEAVTTEPTPGAENIAFVPPEPVTDSGIIISEIVASSSDDNYLAGNDWFELQNTGNSPIYLGDFSIADASHPPHPLPAMTLDPGQFIVIAAVDSDDPAPPSPNVPYKLGSADELSLYLNAELVDYLGWQSGDAPTGQSFSLIGGASFSVSTPTPGQDNRL